MAESNLPASESSSANGGQDGNENPRRNFLAAIASVIIGVVVSVVPLLAGLLSFLDPLRKGRRTPTLYKDTGSEGPDGHIRICALDAIAKAGAPQRFAVISDQIDAWNFTPKQPIGSVYIRRKPKSPGQFYVFNTTCPHAGCSVSCDGRAFVCPCHNSSFDLDGKKSTSESGRENPSPRAMDSLDYQIFGDEIWIKFESFYTGREEKIAKL